jgi:predicted nucleic acid-binding protein
VADGLVDANVFVHAYAHDANTEECRNFLRALERGDRSTELTPLIVHELSYVLPRYLRQLTRSDVANYLLFVLSWPGVEADRPVLTEALERWRDAPGLSFVDAYVVTLALQRGLAVYTKNLGHFRAHGVQVPEPIPS